ncbi:hypothetical protein CR513_06263, partial [Mucuna pruriens]
MRGLWVNQRKIHGISSKVEKNLDCIDCEYLIKVKLICLSFEGYALIWWNEIVLQKMGMRRASIESWEELKRDMRERFIPCYYKRNLFVKLQKMFQDSKSVEEFYKEMKVTLIRAQIVE